MKSTALIAAIAVSLALPIPALAGGTSLDASAPKKEKLFGKFNKADSNADTAISEEEWEAYLETHKSKNAPRFDQIDTDNNERIDESEWQANYKDKSKKARGSNEDKS